MLLFFFISLSAILIFFFFFFNDTATTEIYTLSLHDALPIYIYNLVLKFTDSVRNCDLEYKFSHASPQRSEEHTSELQSRLHLVCRLLLEKKKNNTSLSLHAYRTHVPTT